MAGRTRTQKKLAQRINLDYFKTLHGIPRWRRILSGVFVIVGLAWLGWHAVAGSPKPYNAGPLAQPHHLLGQKCDACHVPQAGFQKTATDQACLGCHDGPIHQADQTFAPACSSCHVEHQGALRLASTSDRACTQCHADLATTHGPSKLVSNIRGFDSQPPRVRRAASRRLRSGDHQVQSSGAPETGSARTQRHRAVEVRRLPSDALFYQCIFRPLGEIVHAADRLRQALRRLPHPAVRPALQRIGSPQRSEDRLRFCARQADRLHRRAPQPKFPWWTSPTSACPPVRRSRPPATPPSGSSSA